jgi:hypothetical protein
MPITFVSAKGASAPFFMPAMLQRSIALISMNNAHA